MEELGGEEQTDEFSGGLRDGCWRGRGGRGEGWVDEFGSGGLRNDCWREVLIIERVLRGGDVMQSVAYSCWNCFHSSTKEWRLAFTSFTKDTWKKKKYNLPLQCVLAYHFPN